MEYPIVYDKKETNFNTYGLAVLENAKDVCIQEKLNGDYNLAFVMPISDIKWRYLTEENIVKIEGQLFVIREIEDERSQGIWRRIKCEHVFFLLLDEYIEDVLEENCTAALALTRVLSGTQFSVGTVSVAGTNTIDAVQVTPITAINQILDSWGGDIHPDNWTVNLLAHRGSTAPNVQIRYRKNLKTIKRNIDTRGVTTRLFIYGKDGLTVEEENPTGQKYIDSPNIGIWRRPKIGKVTFDLDDDADLLDAGRAYLAKIDTPKLIYEVDIIELKALPEYGSIEAIALGDEIKVIDEELQIDVQARIVEYERYPLEPQKSKVTLANFRPGIEDYIARFEQLASKMVTQDKQVSVKTSWLEGAINALKNQLLCSGAYASAQVVEGKGCLYENTDINSPDYGALYIGPGILAIAHEKVGGQWNWRTWGTGKGFTADLINSGTINAGLVNILSQDGCTRMVGDGLRVYNAAEVLQAIWGQYATGEYGGKVMHSDGSYTIINADGLRRYIAGTGKSYLFMINAGTNGTAGECFLCLKRYVQWQYGNTSVIASLTYESQQVVETLWLNMDDTINRIDYKSINNVTGWNTTSLIQYYPSAFYHHTCKPAGSASADWNNRFALGDGTNDNGMDNINENDILEQISPVWITLPSEFNGKDYQIVLSLKDYEIPSYVEVDNQKYTLSGGHKIILEVMEKQVTPVAKFKVKAYCVIRNKWYRPITIYNVNMNNETEQNFYAKGLNFTYTAFV